MRKLNVLKATQGTQILKKIYKSNYIEIEDVIFWKTFGKGKDTDGNNVLKASVDNIILCRSHKVWLQFNKTRGLIVTAKNPHHKIYELLTNI